ncbi:MAG: hypothetical protein RLZZ450_3308 [Pseudomonadota bacterium]|jgi:hypothetical protein
MSSEQRATTIAQASGSKASRESALYGLGCVAVYFAILTLYAQSLHYAPLSLDDQSQLHEVSELPLRALFVWDHFGHFRPLKNLLFWQLVRADDLAAWRLAFVSLFMVTAIVVQLFATRVAQARWFGLAVVSCWALHPAAANAVCWLSAVNGVYALCAMLAYLLLSERVGRASVGRLPRSRADPAARAPALSPRVLSQAAR